MTQGGLALGCGHSADSKWRKAYEKGGERGIQTIPYPGRKRRITMIVYVDESRFMLQPVVPRTWAPRGETHIFMSWNRHDRLSVMTSTSVSPRWATLHLCFIIHEHTIPGQDGLAFVAELLRHIRHPWILIRDRWNVHCSAERELVQC